MDQFMMFEFFQFNITSIASSIDKGILATTRLLPASNSTNTRILEYCQNTRIFEYITILEYQKIIIPEYVLVEYQNISTRILEYWNTRNIKILENQNTKILEYIQNTRIYLNTEYQNTRILEYKNTGIREYWNTGILKFF